MSTQVTENVRVWNEKDSPYFEELDDFAKEILAKFPHAKIHPESYSGGVPGMSAKLPIEDYNNAKEWLASKFGGPETKEPWHTSHTKGVPPLCYRKTPEMEHMKMSHVNLISMMQQKKKQYTQISWM